MQQDEYRKLAEAEDKMWYSHALNRRLLCFLDRQVPPRSARVLDAGCGTGGLIKTLKTVRPEWRMTGLDFMPEACEFAKARTGADILQGSITELPFADGEFDAVVSADVVCQVEDAARAIREFARCVRPGGAVLVNVPAYMWLWSYHDDTCETRHRYTRRELAGLFRKVGLEVDFASYANCLPLPLIALRRKVFAPEKPTSDVKIYPGWIEAVFAGLAWFEFFWMRLSLRSPFGSSVFVAGRKPGKLSKGDEKARTL